MLGKRIASAAVLIPIVGLALYLGGYAISALALLAGLLAGIEYLQLLRQADLVPPHVLVLLLIVLGIADAQWADVGFFEWGLLALVLGGLGAEVFRNNVPGSLSRWAHAIAGGLYIGLSLSYVVRLRALEQGLFWVLLALLGTWICDTGAYLVGCSIGRRKLAPVISPKKTWEGAVGGLVFGLLAVMLLARLMLSLSLWQSILLGVLLVAAATIGDLAESVIKRQVGVKDSGSLIPGHGGMLDRIDSLLFVFPVVYYFATVIARVAQ